MASLIEIPPLSTEIQHHAKQVLTVNRQQMDSCKTQCLSPHTACSGAIKRIVQAVLWERNALADWLRLLQSCARTSAGRGGSRKTQAAC